MSLQALWLLVPAAVLAALAWFLPPDGKERLVFVRFLGHFHPVLLHLPIGFLALVPALELLGATARFAHLRLAAPAVLVLTTLSAVLATALGWMLAWAGSYEGEVLDRHLWGGIVFCVVCALTTCACGRGLVYPILLVASLGTMTLVAHDGATLTHGATFLTQHMPQGLRALFGLPELPEQRQHTPTSKRTTSPVRSPVESGPSSVGGSKPVLGSESRSIPASQPTAAGQATFATAIAPIFDKKCLSCHKPEKKKGELLMTSYEALLEGGDTGPAIVPGDLENSELWRRITLPPDHDEYMPSDGKPALTTAEVALIKAWITAGAPKG